MIPGRNINTPSRPSFLPFSSVRRKCTANSLPQLSKRFIVSPQSSLICTSSSQTVYSPPHLSFTLFRLVLFAITSCTVNSAQPAHCHHRRSCFHPLSTFYSQRSTHNHHHQFAFLPPRISSWPERNSDFSSIILIDFLHSAVVSGRLNLI